ncbi:flagellar basal body-associated FliL family protein [Pseudothauera rhizosphaerae]|uniref:Flagellar protein FliL n=1 Tax=Pseudothauera rhizosphaerae TaxID=2565932 RepID=A0A4S4AWA8_9RHOO|nr:flagellar basal body-associated FliL family protein [Pseudothauera rhizosphaerae]THF64167.1 flagellar basal body protein FliL [Pseudothauera rhizosphaerae]
MAKAPAKPEVAATEAPPPKKSKLLIVVLLIVVLLFLAAAALVGVLLLAKSKGGGNAESAAASGAPAVHKIDLSKPPVFVQLETFTVNLAREEGDHYLQTVIVLRVADATVGSQVSGFMPEIRHRINLLLSSKTPSEVATIEGREQLAREILAQVNSALGFNPPPGAVPGMVPAAPVQGVLFNSFIIQ